MCRKGMAKRVTGGSLGQTRLPDRGCHRFLHDGLMDMMAACQRLDLRHMIGGNTGAARSAPSSPGLIRIGADGMINALSLILSHIHEEPEQGRQILAPSQWLCQVVVRGHDI